MNFRNPLEAIKKLPESKQREVYKSLASRLIEGEFGDILTGLIAAKEINLLEAVQAQHDALDVDHIDDIPTKEERKEHLKGLTEALITDDVPTFWMDHAGKYRLDDPDRARDFLALDADEWGAKCDQIVAAYRKQGNTEMTRSECLADYIGRKFGVDVDEFVANVVAWDENRRREVMRHFLLGNFEAAETGIEKSNHIIRAAVEHADESAQEDDDVDE